MNIFFNNIYVIESLDDRDEKTGVELVKQLGYMIRNEDNLKVQFCDVSSKAEMVQLLSDTKNDALTKGVIPYLHFETHGNMKGLEIKDGDFISWQDFRLLLGSLNQSVKNNVFVSVAACFGGFVFRSISMFERLPFCAFVGPPDETFPDEIQIDWQAYFQTLLKTKSFGEAVDALNENNPRFKYFYKSSENIVNTFYTSATERYQNEEFLQERIEYVLSLARQTPGITESMPESIFRAFLRNEYSAQPKQMQDWEDYITYKTDVMPESLRAAQAYFQGRDMGP